MWSHSLVVTTLTEISVETQGRLKGYIQQMNSGKEVGRKHPNLILFIYFSFHHIWSVAIIYETFPAYHVGPIGSAPRICWSRKSGRPSEFCHFLFLVRMNEGFEALFSAGFGVKESAFSSSWSTGQFPMVEKPLLPVVVSHYWTWLLSRPCYLHCHCFTQCRIKKCAWSRALPCQSFIDTESLGHLVTYMRTIPSLG